MTISSTTRKAGPFSGNGVTVAFPFTFKVFQASDLLVVLTDASGVETTETLTSQYTVSLNANQDSNPGGTVTMVTAPPVGYSLTIGSQVAQTQPAVLTNTGGFYPTVVNDMLDRATVLVQQLSERLSRTIALAFSDSSSLNSTLPTAAQRANKALVFDASGNIGVSADIPAQAAAAATSATAAAASATAAANSAATVGLVDLAVQNAGNRSHSDGTNTLVGSARWFLGNAAPSSDDSALLVGRTLTGSYNTGAHAFRDESTWTYSGAGLTGYASYDAIPSAGGAPTYNHLHAFQARPQYTGSGTLANVRAFHGQVGHTGTGTMTNGFGLWIGDATGTGPITNQYGVWIDPLTRGGGNFAFYSGSTSLNSYHGGRYQFGTAPMISAAGFTTYGSVLSHDTTGQLISNPNLTIINGLLDFHNTLGAAQFWTSGNLKIGVGNIANTTLRSYVPNAVGYKHSLGAISTADGTTYTERLAIAADTGHITPGADNTQNLGSGSLRFATVFAGTGTINTSDERTKQDIGDIDAAVLRAWGKVQFQRFRFKDAVLAKGDGARWHFGVIAQRVKEAFESEGLDALTYGLLCFDRWDDQWEEWGDEFEEWGDEYERTPAVLSDTALDSDGKPLVVQPEGRRLVREAGRRLVRAAGQRLAMAAGERYGVRYEEALVLECAYLRSQIEALRP